MLQERTTVLAKGDASGNDMLLRFDFSSGLRVFGLPTKNHYGGYWDLGPTWNYLVLADTPFLVDAGRFNQTGDILEMMEAVGFNPADLGFILLSHGHEDHDGGVAALAQQTGAAVKAHPVYEKVIRFHPESCPQGANPEFPAKCWNCFMPTEHIEKNCLDYHQANGSMEVEVIDRDPCGLMPGVTTFHTPGHSPDCLTTLLGQEAVIVGDAVLPEISPWPSTHLQYERLAGVLTDWEPKKIFGLQAFVRSLSKLRRLGREKGPLAMLPSHRLYYRDVWNDIDLVERVDELLEHHINRCGEISRASKDKPLMPDEIAAQIFPQRLLKGLGRLMATFEVLSHLELMQDTGDVIQQKDGRFAATGDHGFEDYIRREGRS